MNPLQLSALFTILPKVLNTVAGDKLAWKEAITAVARIEDAVNKGRLDKAKRAQYFAEALTHFTRKPNGKTQDAIINLLRESAVLYVDYKSGKFALPKPAAKK